MNTLRDTLTQPNTSYAGTLDDNGLPVLPATPSYLVGADNHQIGNTGSSIFDPTTWGDRIDNGFKFSVSALTRAVTSTINSAVTVGSWAGLADDSNKVSTQDWLTSMDDDLGQYYSQNKSAVDTVGDVGAAFIPGLGGIKVLNWAQKGIALASEGRAGLSLAAHFGTLPTKQAIFAEAAAADIASSTNTYSIINANLAKSLATGYAQNALEFAAFDVAASSSMKDSPLFTDHDLSDIAYNALLGGGMIGAGIMGTATAVRTISQVRKAGSAVDEATHAYRTVLTEPASGTSPSEGLAIHLNNIEALPTVAADDALVVAKQKGVNETRLKELNAGRLASHALAKSDTELGNYMFDVVMGGSAEDASNKLAGAIRTARPGFIVPEEKIDTNASQFLKLVGEDAGTITDVAPTITLADRSRNSQAVLDTVAKFGHKQGQDWSIATAQGNADAIESRYIKAMETPFDPAVKVGTKDIPFLESGYNAMTADSSIANITLKDGTVLDKSGLYHYLDDLKGTEALRIQAENEVAIGENQLSTNDIAKFVNVSPNFLAGERNVANPAATLFATQSAMAAHTAKQVALGNWRADKGLIKTYLMPSGVKIVYDTAAAQGITEHEVSGMVALKEQQTLYRQQALNVTNNFLGEDAAKFAENLPGYLLAGANRESVGGGLFSSQNGNYKTLASYVQQIGAQTAALLQKKAAALGDVFAASGHKLLNDPEASAEFTKVVQQLRMTPEKYELVPNRGLVNIKQLDYEAAVAAAKDTGSDISKIATPVFEDTKAPVTIPLVTEGMTNFANDWDKYHKSYRTQVTNLRNSQGLITQDSLARTFYVPPIDSRQYPHFAFVVDDSLSGTGHMSMLHANTPAELEALAAKVPTDQGFRVLYKDQSEEWHQAMKNYDYDLGINDNYIDSALKRSGVSAPFFAVTDANKLWDDMMQWRKNQDAGLTRDMLEHRYSSEFAELRRQGEAYDLAQNSRSGYVSDLLKAKTSNPYTDYIKTALYTSREGATPIWSAINRLAETGVSSAIGKLQDAWTDVKSPADLEKINTVLKSIGCNVYTDAATHALANHTAPAPALSNFIRGANSLLSFTMLRSDPMNALNNGLGHAVLYGTELPRLIKEVGGDAVDMALKMPGTANTILSPAKLFAKVNGDWWNKIVGGADNSELYKWAKEGGYLPSFTDQFKTMADNLTLRGGEGAADLDFRLAKATEAAKNMGQWLEKASGNKGVEEYNRFKSAVTAKYVTDAAIAAGKLQPELQASIINTFVNRVEGIHLAAQRPLMFKGAIGQALGLFQTYQFNMLQQMLRYVGDGNTKSVATLLGLQGSIYGLNGLPAFNAMNQYLVGNAAGNIQHNDIVSSTYDVAGKEVGDWLLYGASSNMLLHPDAKINMYSRGDINPRQVTVIPTSLADVPIVGAAAKFFGSMYEATQKINKGADIWGSILQGVEHSGISRPLSGFAQALEASNNPNSKVFSTDNAGNIVMQNDLFSATTAARLLGAKPLDEAVALDAFHRVQVYNATRAKQLENLGEGIKATIAGGNVPTPEQINTFTSEYMRAGGKQQQFNAYWSRQVLNANKSKVNQIVDNASNPGNMYMQKVMGGYDLQDFNNSTEDSN